MNIAQAYLLNVDDEAQNVPKHRLRPVFSLAGLVFISVLAIVTVVPFQNGSIAPRGADCPFDQFSEERARKHLKTLTVDIGIRPCCGEANEQAAQYIYDEMTKLKSQYNSRHLTVEQNVYKTLYDGSFTNVAVVVHGSRNDTTAPALMVSAHLDSVPYGPGATDDGVGVAIMMEAVSVLLNSPPMKNDVIFLFVNGEEVGCLGSGAFRQFSTLRDRPSVVINFEGSGMAEKEALIRSNSAWATQWYTDAAARPLAYSLTEMIFAVLAVGCTDVDVYNRMGLHALDLVYVSKRYAYHTAEDSYENVAEGAVQHGGDNLLSLILNVKDVVLPARLTSGAGVGDLDNSCCRGFDVPIQSGTVFYSLFNTTLWLDKTAASIFLSVLAFLLFGGTLLIAKWFGRVKSGSEVKWKLVCRMFFYHLCSLSFGIILAVVACFSAVYWRDVEVWYGDNNIARVIMYASIVPLPMILFARHIEMKNPQDTSESLEHHCFLSVLALILVLLLLTALALPEMAFIPMWQGAFFFIGYIADLAYTHHVAQRLEDGREAHTSRDAAFDIAYLFTSLFTPLVFALFLVNFLSSSFGYFIDGLSYDASSILEVVYAVVIAVVTFLCAISYAPFVFRFREVRLLWLLTPVLVVFFGSLIASCAVSAPDNAVPPI